MTLKNSLYKIQDVKETTEGVSYSILMNRECPIYQAHFPSMPVTPGACIIQMAGELLADFVKKDLQLMAVKNAKFISVLAPTDEVILVHLSAIKQEEGRIRAQAIVTGCSNTVYAKLSMALTF
ncbi:MAG: hypothetical protein J6W52_12525 [Bacteroidaceae bacterium]|nr:hypothetical protein [Bacteroidaceae bacterium]